MTIPIGTKFTRLTIIGPGEGRKTGKDGWKKSTSICLCSCGKTKLFLNCNLKNGFSKSCGCIRSGEDRKTGTKIPTTQPELINLARASGILEDGIAAIILGTALVIPLTQGKISIVDREIASSVSVNCWAIHKDGYAARTDRLTRRTLLLHRFVSMAQDGLEIDHINRIKLDNRRCNLRECTRTENMRNAIKPRANKTGYRCVTLNKYGTFSAMLRLNNKQIHIGCFKTALEAHIAREAKAKELFGEFYCPPIQQPCA